jgi:hypothetical protein
MNELATVGMVVVFALRCFVPVVIIAALGFALNRLFDHWEAPDRSD